MNSWCVSFQFYIQAFGALRFSITSRRKDKPLRFLSSSSITTFLFLAMELEIFLTRFHNNLVFAFSEQIRLLLYTCLLHLLLHLTLFRWNIFIDFLPNGLLLRIWKPAEVQVPHKKKNTCHHCRYSGSIPSRGTSGFAVWIQQTQPSMFTGGKAMRDHVFVVSRWSWMSAIWGLINFCACYGCSLVRVKTGRTHHVYQRGMWLSAPSPGQQWS